MACEEGPSSDEVCGVDVVSWPSVTDWESLLEVATSGAGCVPLGGSGLRPASGMMIFVAGACGSAMWALPARWSIALFSMPVPVAFRLRPR